MGVTLIPYGYLLVASHVALAMCMDANNTTTAMQDLWNDLFVEQGYSNLIRPVYDDYYPTFVSMSLHLKNIHSFDEVAGILTLNAYMYIYWYDEFLTWNASDYDYLNLARWPQDEVWRPDITLYNTVNSYQDIGHKSILVENHDDGSMVWTPMELFQSSCSVDMTYFPYDIQTCELQFMSWSYTADTIYAVIGRGDNSSDPNIISVSFIILVNDVTGSCAANMKQSSLQTQQDRLFHTLGFVMADKIFSKWWLLYWVELTLEEEEIDQEEYTPNPQWDIISTNMSSINHTSGNNVDMIIFKIKLQRKPRYHLTTMLLPIILLAVLDIFVFALPSDGGEKSGYAVTVFLAFAVFLTIVNSTMPENSEKLSIFSIYIIIQTGQSTLITIISLFSIRLASLDESTKVPSVLAAMTRLIFCRTTCKKTSTTKVNKIGNKEEDEEDVGKYVESDDSICGFDNETCTWKKVANAVDVLCFVIFALTFAMSTTVCFCVITRAN